MYQSNELNPRVYIACLASYNNGIYHGKWIDAAQDEDAMLEEIKDMLTKSPTSNAEEWAIHDTEDFIGVEVKEYTDLETITDIGRFLSEHGRLGAALLEEHRSNIEDAMCAMDCYEGEFDSEKAFTMHLFDELYAHDLPEFAKRYFDYDLFCRDLFRGDYYSINLGIKVHIFRSE